MPVRLKRTILAVCALLALMGTAHAATINIFNTGVDASGNPLPDGTIGDLHYTLITVPGGTTDIRVRTLTGGFPVGPWLADDPISAWIGPNNDSQDDGPIGTYIYRTTFSLTGLIPATAILTGQWATDNPGTDIRINGNSTGISSCCFTSWTPFTISSGFVAGTNTLDFVVVNQGGPTGLRTEISGTANSVSGSSVPEPASFVLLGVGIGAIGLIRRRKA